MTVEFDGKCVSPKKTAAPVVAYTIQPEHWSPPPKTATLEDDGNWGWTETTDVHGNVITYEVTEPKTTRETPVTETYTRHGRTYTTTSEVPVS